MLTVGVEEEFLLLDPDGALAPVAPDVLRHAGAGHRVAPEYMAYQVETDTPVCTRLDDLRGELLRQRLHAARGAERAGVRLVAAGAPPFAAGPVRAVTDDPRYRELARRFPAATAGGATCACQVHVGVADRDLAVGVLAGLRPWLPVLLALAGNSPFAGGADSGWSSARYPSQLLWPTFRPPEVWAGARHYDAAVRRFIAHGDALDAAGVYLLARLSDRYPTVEVRVMDACLTAEDAVLVAGVVRALVASVIEEVRHGIAVPAAPRARVGARLLAAARYGMSAGGPETTAADLVTHLLARIASALEAAGDADEVRGGLDRLLRTGTGAQRQRAMRAGAATRHGFVSALAEATAPVASVS